MYENFKGHFYKDMSPVLICEKNHLFEIENAQIFIYLLFYVAFQDNKQAFFKNHLFNSFS